MKKISLLILMIITLCLNVWAIEYLKENMDKEWHLMEKAKISIETKDFGTALLYVEKAVEVHTQMCKKKL